MRVLSFVFAVSLAAVITGASAQTAPVTDAAAPTATTAPAPAATPAPAAEPTASDDDVVSCRYEKTTGSLFSKRICHTQREWRQMTADSRALMDNVNDHSRMGGVPGGSN
jgi:hypothetical protein